MGISRVQKFKEYRDSLIKEEAPNLETPKSSSNINIEHSEEDTTSTLPLDQVIKTMNDSEEELVIAKKQRNKTILKYCLIGLGAAILIAGIVIFGILVWSK